IRLVPAPPLSSSLANRVSAPSADPVKIPTTVSNALPLVSMKDEGADTENVQGAVHVHHTLGVPLPPPTRSFGSFASTGAPTFEPKTVRDPSPGRRNRPANASFDSAA